MKKEREKNKETVSKGRGSHEDNEGGKKKRKKGNRDEKMIRKMKETRKIEEE